MTVHTGAIHDRPHAASLGALPRKPLYLVASSPMQVDTCHEALTVKRAGAPVQRFPLARLARVICNRHTTWTGEALCACLAHTVPITWLDGHGRALGNSQPRIHTPEPLDATLDLYLELPDWHKRLDNWLTRRRLETLTQWAMHAATRGAELDPVRFQVLKREFVYGGHVPVCFEPAAEGWCEALAAGHLNRGGLQSRYWGCGGVAMDLAAELAGLLWAELNLDCGALPASADSMAVSLRLFEAWAHRREGRLDTHLSDLRRHVAREIDAWR